MKKLKCFLYHLVRNCSLKLRGLNKTLISIKRVGDEKKKWQEVARVVTVLWGWTVVTVVVFESPQYAAPLAAALLVILAHYLRRH